MKFANYLDVVNHYQVSSKFRYEIYLRMTDIICFMNNFGHLILNSFNRILKERKQRLIGAFMFLLQIKLTCGILLI
jgi:hypothetical protein